MIAGAGRRRRKDAGHDGLVAELRSWLARGAKDQEAPALPDGVSAAELGRIYERHLLPGRRERGAYYTPPALVETLVKATLGPLDPREKTPVVLDPACGAGAFLLAAAAWIGGAAPPGGPLASGERSGLAGGAGPGWLHGLDSDPGAVAVARLALACQLGVPIAAIDGVRCADALLAPGLAPGSVDVVLGNPPFLGEEDHGERFALLRRSPLGRHMAARVDCAYLFVHVCLDLLRPGGRMGMVLPETLGSATGGLGLRRRLAAETRIESITMLDPSSASARFDHAPGQKTCLLVLQKEAAPEHRPLLSVLGDGPGDRGAGGGYLAPQQSVLLDSGGRFRLSPPDADALCSAMERRGTALSRTHRISTGIQAGPGRVNHKALRRLAGGPGRGGRTAPTGRSGLPGEGVFVLTQEEADRLKLSEAERGLLRPFYPAHELRPFSALPAARHVILYLTEQTCPDLSPYPALSRHLARFRAIMGRRRETGSGHRPYFHLHWPRQEDRFLMPKLLSVRQTPRPCVVFAPGAAFVDLAVNVIAPLGEGIAGFRGFSLPALAALLSSAPVHYYLHHRGKRKGELLQVDGAPLAALPVPPWEERLARDLDELAARIGAAVQHDEHQDRDERGEPGRDSVAMCRELDERVAAAYGLAEVPARPGAGSTAGSTDR